MSTSSFSVTPPVAQSLFTLADGVELVLASASPRRRQFLTDWGVPFRLASTSAEEPRPAPGESPDAYTRRAAVAKARAVANELGMDLTGTDTENSPCGVRRVILAADTVVAMNGDILGKPEHPGHALHMLERLNGHGHEVISAVCLLLPDPATSSDKASQLALPAESPLPRIDESRSGACRQLVFSDTSRVFFHQWSRSVLEAYVRTGEPDDKAGAYAIQGQGAVLVDRMEGSWSTVVGLPVTPLARLLLHMGLMVPTPQRAGQ